ncbi:hypothetical protein J3458_004287 [Metarhizium acridum]|uniref:uncharacterized protein n=1 Tax=Metarhizium acridum TaxID=92637 RepID=UPI001C6B3E5C|nr:hypothetical protein J3458_004287 [Metarhizium acridum]
MHAWRKDQERLKELQDNIRTVKSSLNIMLGAENSEDLLRIRLDIQTISASTTQASRMQIVTNEKFMDTLTGVEYRIARVEEMLQEQSRRLQMSQYTQVKSAYGTERETKTRSAAPGTFSISSQKADFGLGIRVTPFENACRRDCHCSCHTLKRSSSPAFLSNLLGRLFVGYTGLPVLSPKCDNAVCQASRSSKVSVEYWFPANFWSNIIQMELSYHQTTGPSLQLRTLRGVPDNAQCVNFALNGNMDGLKFLFRQGLASPRDVSTTRGYSILRWALYGKQYETCKFLIQAGAGVDYKPLGAFDNSPRIKACHFLLEGNLSESAAGALRAITNGSEYLDDFIEESNFTRTHRIILGLSIGDLERELISHPGEINAQDSMGRTALAWAAARGDSHSILTLLRYGADPNIIDSQISGPLSNASAQGHTACVKLLLDAGANPDPPLPGGINKGGPLNVAARRSDDPILVKLLLDFGAEVDQVGVDGKTALCHAAQNNDASLAILLLEYGAEINKATITGDTPLTVAITHNSHYVLRLFLERWHHYSTCPRLKGPHLLEITAKYGDLETMGILANTNHFRLKYDEKYTFGDFSKVIQERPDATEKLTLAFEELLSIFKHAPHTAEEQESLMEAGCWPCLTSRSTTWETAIESPQQSDNESDDQLHNTQALPEDDNRHE